MPTEMTSAGQGSGASLEYWEDQARDIVQKTMRSRRITYKELARRLEKFGIDELPDQINRKVNRKRFSAAFFLACLSAMEVRSLPIAAKSGAERTVF